MKKPSTYYAVAIHPEVPKEILVLLDEYLFVFSGSEGRKVSCVFCASVDSSLQFVELELLPKDGFDTWKVQLPASYIIAIADMSKKKSGPGFLRNEKE